MMDKVILLLAIIMLFIGVVFVLLSREIVRKKGNVNNENVAVKIFKLVGFVVVIISFVTIYFCLN